MSQLQLSDFKVGDRVKVVNYTPHWNGAVGIVCQIKNQFVEFTPDLVQPTNTKVLVHNWQDRKFGAGFWPNQLEILEVDKKEEKRNMSLETIRIVDQWIQAGNQFTVFDVTRELRALGNDVRHNRTLGLVHGLFNDDLPPFRNTGTIRSTKSFTTSLGVQDTAEVYSHNSDSQSYDPDALDSAAQALLVAVVTPAPAAPAPAPVATKPTPVLCDFCGTAHPYLQPKTPKVVTSAAPTKVSSPVATKVVSGAKTYKVDNRGRICVRQGLIKSLNVKPGERVYLRKNAYGSGFNLSANGGTDTFGSLRVDKDTNIRVSRYLQKKSGLNDTKFSMSQVGSKIVVSL